MIEYETRKTPLVPLVARGSLCYREASRFDRRRPEPFGPVNERGDPNRSAADR
jgi:hypothetical protein